MLYRAKNSNELESIAGTTVASGDTSPIGTTMLYDGDDIPSGWQEVEEVYSNPNLLINGDFRNPVNQRGKTSYTSTTTAVYSTDRWRLFSASLDVLENKSTLTTINNVGWLTQFIEINLTGMEVCFSCKINDKTHIYNTVVQDIYLEDSYTSEDFKVRIRYLKDKKATSLEFEIPAGRDLNIEWVKLELGSIATPFVPRLYGEELTLCKRYYQVVCCSNSFSATSTTAAHLSSYNIYTMATNPTSKKINDGTLSNVDRLSHKAFMDRFEISAYATSIGFLRYQNATFELDAEIY